MRQLTANCKIPIPRAPPEFETLASTQLKQKFFCVSEHLADTHNSVTLRNYHLYT